MASPINEMCIGFQTRIPDDTEWDENGELSRPGGQDLLAHVREHLQSLGYETTDPTMYSHFGWEMDVKRERTKARLVVQFIDPWLIIAKGIGGMLRRADKLSSLSQLRIDLRDWMENSAAFINPVFGSRRDLIEAGYKLKDR